MFDHTEEEIRDIIEEYEVMRDCARTEVGRKGWQQLIISQRYRLLDKTASRSADQSLVP